MSNVSTNKFETLNKSHNQNYIYMSRLVLLYTFIGVTYLLFFKSNPQCHCSLFNNISTTQLLPTNTLLTTRTNISTTTNTVIQDIPIIPSHGSKRHLLATNTTIRSVKRNYELIQNLYSMLPNGIIIIWYGLTSSIPVGWSLCDGTNGTPDLQGKFIIGSSDDFEPGSTGGSNEITIGI
eukprot:287795_1